MLAAVDLSQVPRSTQSGVSRPLPTPVVTAWWTSGAREEHTVRFELLVVLVVAVFVVRWNVCRTCGAHRRQKAATRRGQPVEYASPGGPSSNRFAHTPGSSGHSQRCGDNRPVQDPYACTRRADP